MSPVSLRLPAVAGTDTTRDRILRLINDPLVRRIADEYAAAGRGRCMRPDVTADGGWPQWWFEDQAAALYAQRGGPGRRDLVGRAILLLWWQPAQHPGTPARFLPRPVIAAATAAAQLHRRGGPNVFTRMSIGRWDGRWNLGNVTLRTDTDHTLITSLTDRDGERPQPPEKRTAAAHLADMLTTHIPATTCHGPDTLTIPLRPTHTVQAHRRRPARALTRVIPAANRHHACTQVREWLDTPDFDRAFITDEQGTRHEFTADGPGRARLNAFAADTPHATGSV